MQNQAGAALGIAGAGSWTEVGPAQAILERELPGKRCLLVLDDVWDYKHAIAFGKPGPDGRLLFTTRLSEIVHNLRAAPLELDTVSEGEALELLALAAGPGQSLSGLPPDIQAVMKEVARECGYLPLALAMSGARVKGKTHLWPNVRDALKARDLTRFRSIPGYDKYPHLMRAIEVSVEALDEEQQRAYLNLAVIGEDTPVPLVALQKIWSFLPDFEVAFVVEELVARSLARRDSQGRLTLHDLQYDYIYTRRKTDLPALHARLLEAYLPGQAGEPRRWWTVRDDGYLYDHLAQHLVEAGRPEELAALLFDYDWLAVRVKAQGVEALLTDYARFIGAPAQPATEAARLVASALRLSSHILTPNPIQLASQLRGRLLQANQQAIKTLLGRVSQSQKFDFFLQNPSLNQAGGPLLRTFQGHTGLVNAVAVLPGGKQALSAADDHTLKLWDLDSGQVVATFVAHAPLLSCACSEDGQTVVAGDSLGNLHILRLVQGTGG